MSLNKEFCKSPYRFMEQHVVIVTVSDKFKSPGKKVQVFVVEAKTLSVAEDSNRKVCRLFVVGDPLAPKAPKPTLQVYWCNYESNTNQGTVLGTKCDYMFTPTMSGCTFGIGSQDGSGVVRVAHCNVTPNMQNLTSAKEVNRTQANQQYVQLDTHFSHSQDKLRGIVAPYVYMVDRGKFKTSRQATTFGLRNDKNKWEFHSQIYQVVDRTYNYLGLKDFTHNII